MAKPEQPRRRFAPVPIETSFESFRNSTGKQKRVIQHQDPQDECPHQQVRMRPEPELTPEPSPRSPSPGPRELLPPQHVPASEPQPKPQPQTQMKAPAPRRRFAPQLIETSRRSRRVGDTGPATRPADKTDISPYTKNIYTASSKPHRGRKPDVRTQDRTQELSRTRSRHENASPIARVSAPMRRESEDENVTRYLLELAAKEAERQMQETAMAAFPNSHAREGGIDHFYFRESSESDNSPESTSPVRKLSTNAPVRRSSSDQPINWWHKHMQEHAENITKEHEDMVVDEPPQDLSRDFPHTEIAAVPEAESESEDGDVVMRTDSDLDRMDLTAPPDPMWTTSKKPSTDAHRPIGESLMPLIQADPYVTNQSKDKKFSPSPSPRPIGESVMPFIPSAPAVKPADVAYGKSAQIPPDTSFRRSPGPFGRPFGGLGYKPPTPQFQKRRPMVSPPMLGKDFVFRRCPSPKQTKLEPDHPFAQRHAEERYRDVSGQRGLWRGYCYRSESNDESLVPADLHAPPMLGTLQPPAIPGQPHSSHVNHFDHDMWEEPAHIEPIEVPAVENRGRSREPKGLHLLHGTGTKFQRERNPELDEKIALEFDDSFVTQVYNYLSLGYPAMARSYDEELSQISTISIDDLEKDDEKQMAMGHLVEADHDTPRDERCPRWKALRSYIFEWARQHPNLDNMDPVAWGVRERRGSWAI